MVAASYCSSNQLQENLPAFRVDTVARSVILIMSTESVPATVVEDIQEEEETQEAVGLKSPHEDHDDEADGAADEHTKLAEEITEIINRVAASEFPPVLASKQGGMEPATASQVLAWVDKTHHVKITSYIAEQYAIFREKSQQVIGNT